MASKSRQVPRKNKPNRLAEFGLFDIPDLDDMNGSDDDIDADDGALESELDALLSGKAPATKPSRQRPKGSPALDIEQMAKACLQDDEEDEDDANLSNDEDLLSELHTLTKEETTSLKEESKGTCSSPDILEERLIMYEEAVKAAKINKDLSKIRRYERAVKTLKGLIRSAQAGAEINEEEIPPVVKLPKMSNEESSNKDEFPQRKTPISTDSSEISAANENRILDVPENTPSEEMALLTSRRSQYKVAALQAKKMGDREQALTYLKTLKTLDAIIAAVQQNVQVDLSNIPPPPPPPNDAMSRTSLLNPSQKVITAEVQESSDLEKAALAAASEPETAEVFNAPPAPSTIMEALEQRLEKYKSTKQAAEAEGNNAKARRLMRIVKQYETAIKDFKAGKPVQFEELPTPPGFAAIPVNCEASPTNPQVESKSAKATQEPVKRPKVSPGPAVAEEKPPAGRKPRIQRANTSSASDKQLEFLLERQKLFRQAALNSKKSGDLQQAKEYLRLSKGFDSMIEAIRCGLPVDVSNVPTPPQLESDFVIVDASECVETDGKSEELFEELLTSLNYQIDVATKNKMHFLRLGDVTSASKFEKLALESKKDLSVIQHCKSSGESVPKFRYETRMFSMVICNTDLAESDLEIKVCRGIDLPGPPDQLDSFIRIEFPIPNDVPQKAKTHTVRDTNNPTFDEVFKFTINRQSRSQLRQFKRQSIKLEIMSKGGFLRSDVHLATAYVKLVDLESKCIVHDSYSLLDSRRKALGGRLEVIMRIREPLLSKQVEEIREKWLLIGV